MVDKLNKKELEIAVNQIPYDHEKHALSTGVYGYRYANGTVRFWTIVWGKSKEHSLRQRFDTYDEAVKAYDKFVKKHGLKSRKFQDLTGKQFGHLKVLRRAKSRKGNSYWECACDLDGNIVEVEMGALIRGQQVSCGQHKDGKIPAEYSKEQTAKYKGTMPGALKRKRPVTNTSGIKGVAIINTKYGPRYKANLTVRGKRYYGSLVKNLTEAATELHELERQYKQPVLDEIAAEEKKPKYKDLTGQVFGSLVVIKRVDDYVSPKGKREPKWLCHCDCGNTNEYTTDQLTLGKAVTCGDRTKHDPNWRKGYEAKKVDGVATFLYKRRARTNTGLHGITRKTTKLHGDRYFAQLKVAGKLVLAKTFDTLDEAIAARKAAEDKYIPKNKE